MKIVYPPISDIRMKINSGISFNNVTLANNLFNTIFIDLVDIIKIGALNPIYLNLYDIIKQDNETHRY